MWELHEFAANLAEAKAILYPEADEPSPTGPVPKSLGSGNGKHRKPQAPGPDGGGRAQR